MTTQIDVLAVMDSYAEVFDPNNGRDGKDMAEARAAVAELIEAAKDLKETCNRPSAARTRAQAWRRLDAAIAKATQP